MAQKQNYRIAKDNFDGTEETVWTKCCTLKEAEAQFQVIIDEQSYAFHEEKSLPRWRQIRLYDESNNCLYQES